MKRAFVVLFLLMLSALPSLAQDKFVVSAEMRCEKTTLTVKSNQAFVVYATVSISTATGKTLVMTSEPFTLSANGTLTTAFTYEQQSYKTPLTYTVTLYYEQGTLGIYSQTNDCIGDAPRLNGSDFPPPVAVYCTSNGGLNLIRIERGQGVESKLITTVQMAQGLLTAQQTGQHTQIIGTTSGMGLWALTSGELQATLRGVVNYDFIFPVTYCGGINLSGVTFTPTITTTTTTPPTSPSIAPSVTSGGTCSVVSGARFAHVVLSGETLYRIGLRYGVPFATIATFNGLGNANRIFAGQCLQIP